MCLNGLILHRGGFPGSSDECSSNVYKSSYNTIAVFLTLYSLGSCRCLEVNIFVNNFLISNCCAYNTKSFP